MGRGGEEVAGVGCLAVTHSLYFPVRVETPFTQGLDHISTPAPRPTHGPGWLAAVRLPELGSRTLNACPGQNPGLPAFCIRSLPRTRQCLSPAVWPSG